MKVLARNKVLAEDSQCFYLLMDNWTDKTYVLYDSKEQARKDAKIIKQKMKEDFQEYCDYLRTKKTVDNKNDLPAGAVCVQTIDEYVA